MIFGYTTGTDSTIDISKLFYEETEKSNINIFEFLYKDFKLENNIFGYSPLEAIKFTYIPEEIKMFIINLDYIEDGYDEKEDDKIQIKEPYIFCSDNEESKLCNNDHVFEYELLIEQNKELIKNSQYYFIEYQYIVKEIISNCPKNSYGSNVSDSSYNSYGSESSYGSYNSYDS